MSSERVVKPGSLVLTRYCFLRRETKCFFIDILYSFVFLILERAIQKYSRLALELLLEKMRLVFFVFVFFYSVKNEPSGRYFLTRKAR